MQAILASMVDGLVAVDKEGRISKVNRAAEGLFMLQERHLLGQTFRSLLNTSDLHDTIIEVLRTGVEFRAEHNIFPNQENIYRINIVPLKGEKDDIEGALAVFHDITDARKFDRMRSEFVANVSHELRTPLTSIKGFVETLLDGALEDKMLCRRFLTIIDSETDRLTRLIDDLLTLSAMETKEIGVNLQNVNLVESVKNVFNIMGPQAEDKNLRMELIYSPQAAWVKADQDLIRQVLINLIDNAIKYSSDDGKIVVRIFNENGKTVTKVSDTGIGIAQESLQRVFERFYRVDRARSRVFGGTGLGLAIVKHIVELHGGEVFVSSQIGVGSTFTFCLPAGDQVCRSAESDN
ncbi:MAG: PAS domain-containing protein [Syntrophomonadaceae bacterium]|jgi:two-component system phosphate regulon sensor histidine kinase PhoR|nr:PAS domain-containing protein [Syntrophomonadaceae bacterium]